MAAVNAVGNALTGLTGSGLFVGATSPSITTPTIVTSLTFSPTTGGIVGTTTNDSTAAGNVGEVISSQIVFGSAVSLTTATVANVTSISLTAGDWDVSGNVFFNGNAGVNNSDFSASISTTTAGQSDQSLRGQMTTAAAGVIANLNLVPAQQRFSLSGTTTVYLTAVMSFTAGAATACGFIMARRAR